MAFKKFSLENLDEEFYQISLEVLESFPKYRPPLDLFIFKEEVAQIYIYHKKGERLTNEKREQLEKLCASEEIFVSRSDHSIYAKHISKQLDLILVDSNLKEHEIAEIFQNALHDRLNDFFEQPLKVVYDKLYSDLMVLTEYLFKDHYRIKSLTGFTFPEYSLPGHSFNSGIYGLWIYLKTQQAEIGRKSLDQATVAFFLHDLGMSKIPAFIYQKNKALTPEDREKLNQHPNIGAKMIRNLDITDEEIMSCALFHHERMDGSGYPRGVKELSYLVKICCIVDSFAAMIEKNPYSEAMDPKRAAAKLMEERNKYDPELSRALLSLIITGK